MHLKKHWMFLMSGSQHLIKLRFRSVGDVLLHFSMVFKTHASEQKAVSIRRTRFYPGDYNQR